MKNPIVGVNRMVRIGVSEHAEMNAVRLNKTLQFSTEKCNMLVVRLSNTGQIGESRPCCQCLQRLQKYSSNIKWVYYSTSEGRIVREQLRYMLDSEKTYVSYGERRRLRNMLDKI